jgi:hypothetical protein
MSRFACLLALLPMPLIATDSEEPPLERTWTASLQAGFSSTFQLMLGGTFGEGPDIHDKLAFSAANLSRRGDSLTLYGWSTADVQSLQPNWQAGLSYKVPVFERARQKLMLGGGAQRWLFPSVKTGAKDWLVTGNLTYSTSWKRVPIVVTEDSYTLLKSTLPTGSLLYSQIYSEHALFRRGGVRIMLREGPQYTYSWGFYGARGNRVLRYTGCLLLSWKSNTLETSYRQQFGLQDGIPYNRYWSVSLTRQVGGAFHAAHRE